MECSLYWHGIDLRWAYTNMLPSIHRRSSHVHQAYDILHDALVRFALSKSPYRIQQPEAYLQTIVRNLLLDSHREAARFVPLSTESHEEVDKKHGLYDENQIVIENFAPSPEHLADIQQRLTLLQSIIDCLPPRCREVFWLFRIEGMRQQAIAEHLGISLNMVERHVMRALLDLRAAKELI